MPSVLTAGSTVKCLHQGTVSLSASQQKLKVGGNAVLVMGDLMGKSISGCSTPDHVPPPPPATKKCMTTASMIAGAAVKLKVDGRPVLLDLANGLTDGMAPAPVPGTWSVQSAGQTKLSTS